MTVAEGGEADAEVREEHGNAGGGEQRQERLSGEELVRDGPNLLPARYAKSETTPFEFTVVSGENTVSPLNIEP